MILVSILIASLLTAACGRAGGMGKPFNTKCRDLGVPTLAVLLLLLLGVRNPIALFLSFGLMFAALTTYWDFIFKYDNFWCHGFFIGLSLLPIAYTTNHWVGLLSSVTLYTVWMGLWSKIISWDVAEEFGRYAIIPLGIWILCSLT
jgi:hypothetical protein